MITDGYGIGTIPVAGCLTDRLTLTNAVPADEVPEMIERDRVLMAARPGMHLKLLPLLAEPDADTVLSGGAYLFDTMENAERFGSWVNNQFELDGILFPDRPVFLECSYKVWQVIEAENFRDLFTGQGLMRVEEWRLDEPVDIQALRQHWQSIRANAVAACLSAAWLLYNPATAEVSIVTTAPSKSSRGEDTTADVAGLAALAALSTTGASLERPGVEKIFDRTSFIYSVWFPVTGNSDDKPPLFPNSPPFPAPGRIR